MTTIWILLAVVLVGICFYNRLPLWLASLVVVGYLSALSYWALVGWMAQTTLWIIGLAFLVILNIKPLRRYWFSAPAFAVFRKVKPSLSSTEKQAIAVGTVGWEGELFAGKPNWSHLINYKPPRLSQKEQDFLDGPVHELCAMIDNWYITHQLRDIPSEIWQFLKDQGFFGIIIPERYGGLGFSALAHSDIIVKIASRSISLATVVSVPNSLGPGELLIHYGTEDQRQYYLPRLAAGDEIPAFGLTSPHAGSDATSITDTGVVCQARYEGKEQLCIKLNWSKRYITLAPVATVLGLAFRLFDPEGLLGNEPDLGITCALVPTNLPGISIGRRHFPLDAAFPNGPTQGEDVIIPVDWIIGGRDNAGRGWQMVVECLSVGRAISLPAMTTGASQTAVYASGAYARVRQQFGQPIGFFEGIEEPLARMAGTLFIMNSTRLLTLSAIDRGEQPVIPAAISKYHVTERGRLVAMDSMDIHGGKGICMGPSNYLAQPYEEMPISITVEGANILTRSMVIFGQGAIRCHPYLLDELQAAENPDTRSGLQDFDQALFGHIGYFVSNIVRALWLGLTQGRFVRITRKLKKRKSVKRHYQQLTRMSAAFALMSDMTLILLGSQFKKRERLSGRFADILSFMYMNSAMLKHYDNTQGPDYLAPVVQWACQELMFQAQEQMDAVLTNYPNKLVGRLLRWLIFPLGRRFHKPSDRLEHKVAQEVLEPNGMRNQLASMMYISEDGSDPVGFMESALTMTLETAPLARSVRHAVKEGKIKSIDEKAQIEEAVQANILTDDEGQQLLKAYEKRMQAIMVDDFDPAELTGRNH